MKSEENKNTNYVITSDKIRKTLDDLPFTSFHFRILYGLGISWIIDGYEVSLLSVLSGILKLQFNMDDLGIAQAGSFYLLGCVFGAILFAYLSSNFGRKKLFSTTLIIYIISIIMTTFAYTSSFFYLCRFFTGISVGGEYTAIFAAIDEIIPVKYRGMSNIIIDGTWHLGSIFACLLSYSLLRLYSTSEQLDHNNFKNTNELNQNSEYVWRFLFLLGAIVAVPIIFIRKHIPESPRWLYLKGNKEEALKQLKFIKNEIKKEKIESLENCNQSLIQEEKDSLIEEEVKSDGSIEYPKEDVENKNKNKNINEDSKFYLIFHIFFIQYPSRFFYALLLMISQAFFYNGLYYTFGLVLETYYNINKESFGIYLIPLSISNFIGPLLLGRFFDSWSRRKMISLCYFSSGIILTISAYLFTYNLLTVHQQILVWSVLFFIASPGASAAHLTVSEIFPTDIRSEALACFFSTGLLIGGVISPLVFGSLIDKNDRKSFAYSYFISAGLLILAGIVSFIWGVDSENKSLEEICKSKEENVL